VFFAIFGLVPVGVGGQVGPVDGNVPADGREPLAEGREYVLEALTERPIVALAELPREAVARPLARSAAEHGADAGMLGGEAHGAAPCRQRLEALDEAHADHRADRIAGSAGPAHVLDGLDQSRDFGRVEYLLKLVNRRWERYLRNVHGAVTSVVQTPGGANRAGVVFLGRSRNFTPAIGRKTAKLLGNSES